MNIILFFLWLLDKKLSLKIYIFLNWNLSININPENIKILSLDASRLDESNKLNFIFLQSLDVEIFQKFKNFSKFQKFWKFQKFPKFKIPKTQKFSKLPKLQKFSKYQKYTKNSQTSQTS